MIRFWAIFVSTVFAVLLIFVCAQYAQERRQLENARQQLHDDIEKAVTSPDPIERAIGRRAAVANRDLF